MKVLNPYYILFPKIILHRIRHEMIDVFPPILLQVLHTKSVSTLLLWLYKLTQIPNEHGFNISYLAFYDFLVRTYYIGGCHWDENIDCIGA